MEDGGGRESDKPLLITEGAMFRVFLGVAIAAAPIILVGLLAGPFWGALVLCVEIGVGVGIGVRAYRARRASRADDT